MTHSTIHPILLVLIIIAGTACLSLIVLSIGLYINLWRQDKEDLKTYQDADKNPRSAPRGLPDIMGLTRKVERQTPPNTAIKSQNEKRGEKSAMFAHEIPSEELDHVFGDKDDNGEDTDPDPEEEEVDLQDEELELQAYRTPTDNEFATGNTFEELDRTSALLQKDKLEPAEQETVVDMAVSLAGTDLWEMITQAIPQANEKIAKMLDTPSGVKPNSRPDYWENFDIRDFI